MKKFKTKNQKKSGFNLKDSKRKARHLMIQEGIFSRIKQTLGNNYISAFAIAIRASNQLIAFLFSITSLIGPLSQLFSSKLVEKYSRKKIVTTALLLEIILWFPLIIIAFLFYKGILTSILPLMLLIFFSLTILLGNIGHPAWFSWIGSLITKNHRGTWFAKRNFILDLISLILSILSAILLDYFKKNDSIMIGFIILFSLAGIGRIIAREYFKKIYEPKFKLKEKNYFNFFNFVKKASKNNFGKFAIFTALFYLAVSIAGPFFTIYMLKNLGFDYITFMIVISSQILFGILSIKFWGKFSDKYGNYESLKITAILIPSYPILWLFSKSPIYLIFVPSLIAGIAWAGFNLACNNFIYDSIKTQKRSLASSYFNVFVGFGIFLGAGIGGILIKNLTITFMDPILFIFLISSFMRAIITLIAIPYIKEIKKTQKFDGSKIIKNLISKNIPSLEDKKNFHLFIDGNK